MFWKLWLSVSSHTARCSAANMYLIGRMNTYEIMQLIEHTSENNVLEIYKVSSEQSAVYNANGSF